MSSPHAVNVSGLLRELRDAFEHAGIDDPDTDAELLIGFVLGESRGRVQSLAILGAVVDSGTAERIRALGAERARRIPLQHLTGCAPFRQLELRVGPGVFIPRPETETVAQFAIDELQADAGPEPRALDLCTGSGALALALATEVDRARVWAVEKDENAHAWARLNVDTFGAGRVKLLHGDVTETFGELEAIAGTLTVITANPPYVPTEAVPRDPEVRDHDPRLALYSGTDGLDLIRELSSRYRRFLRPGGLIVLEHAESQGEAVRNILTAHGWSGATTHRDLTLRDRATTARA